MGRYYYRQYYYHGASDYDKVSQYFLPIMADLEREFFSLSESQLDCYFEKYRQNFGDSACSYARRTYPRWKSRSVRMSAKTLTRMLEYVPAVLDGEKRISLIEKLLKYYKKDQIKETIRFVGNWDNYEFQILNAQKEIRQRFENTQKNGIDWEPNIPFEVAKVATWLFDDDAVAFKQLMENLSVQDYERIYHNAVNDLISFHNHCKMLSRQRALEIHQNLQENNKRQLYKAADITVSLPDTIIYVCVSDPQQKNIEASDNIGCYSLIAIVIFIIIVIS